MCEGKVTEAFPTVDRERAAVGDRIEGAPRIVEHNQPANARVRVLTGAGPVDVLTAFFWHSEDRARLPVARPSAPLTISSPCLSVNAALESAAQEFDTPARPPPFDKGAFAAVRRPGQSESEK